jgi:hypothetical protein
MIRRAPRLSALSALLLGSALSAGSTAIAAPVTSFDAYLPGQTRPARHAPGRLAERVRRLARRATRNTHVLLGRARRRPAARPRRRAHRAHRESPPRRTGKPVGPLPRRPRDGQARPRPRHGTRRRSSSIFRQAVGGVELVRSDMKVLMTRTGELVAISGSLHPAAVAGVDKKLEGPAVSLGSAAPSPARSPTPTREGRRDGPRRHEGDQKRVPPASASCLPGDRRLGQARLRAPGPREEGLSSLPDTLVPAYYVEIQPGKKGVPDSDMFAYVDRRGRRARAHPAESHAADSFQYRVWADPAGSKALCRRAPPGLQPSPDGRPRRSAPASRLRAS